MSYRAFEVRRIAGALGAELAGVDLREPLDDAVIAEIRRALLDHQGIFFRDQHLTPEQHLAFGRRFGSLNVHDFVGGRHLYVIIGLSRGAASKGSWVTAFAPLLPFIRRRLASPYPGVA